MNLTDYYETPSARCVSCRIEACIAVSQTPVTDSWSDGSVYDWE